MFEAFMISCEARTAVRAATLASLEAGGWNGPTSVVLDDETGATPIERIGRTWRRVVERAAASAAPLVFLLEDDLVVGRWFMRNLTAWPVLRRVVPGQPFFASLYRPPLPYYVQRPAENYLVAHAPSVWGSQALVTTPSLARYFAHNWDGEEGNPDMKMPRLAARVAPVYVHLPSLVDHADVPTTWGGISHRAVDFDPDWRSPHVTADVPPPAAPPRGPAPTEP